MDIRRCAAMRPVYTACDAEAAEAAEAALLDFSGSELGRKYSAAADV